MRTQEEIVNRYNEQKKEDFFGFETSEYVHFLDWDHLKQFLKEDAEIDKLLELEPPDITSKCHELSDVDHLKLK